MLKHIREYAMCQQLVIWPAQSAPEAPGPLESLFSNDFSRRIRLDGSRDLEKARFGAYSYRLALSIVNAQ